jgi:AcrR family transcriptional regulator
MPSTDLGAPPRKASRGRPARISQDDIVEAAIRLGLDSFSMQGIAEQLGVTPPALYSHVAGRDEVLALVNAALQARLDEFTSPAIEWRDWLTDFARSVRTHLAPSASTIMLGLARPEVAGRVELGERGLQLLIDAGLPPTDAAYAVWLVFRVAITAGPEHETVLAGYVSETGDVLAPGSAGALPATAAVHRALSTGLGHDTFPFDLDLVLAGIADLISRRTVDEAGTPGGAS